MIVLASLINTLVVALVVLIHYQFLYMLTKYIPKLKIKHNYRIVLGVFGALLAHSIEVWVFGLAYYLKLKSGLFGHFEGNFDGSLLDCVYFSFTSFTTLGFGDIAPLGNIRFLSGIESLTGLVLITWSASFLFFEMQRYWKVK
ncbi:potassium channel family protein [Marinicella sp. S1101]|uniref:potassium channel family protein n=1 Tax=Marinicella marina TaxID=2996016 RepID=UPI002260FDF2|nr:potassium channel family protein [Marinicella marina]MCX7553210.1 potassium channel family protein [Marinicella marina]MDJ1138942.1 potassium channel family protein [Marinicella marina]